VPHSAQPTLKTRHLMENVGSFRMSTQEERQRSPALNLGHPYQCRWPGDYSTRASCVRNGQANKCGICRQKRPATHCFCPGSSAKGKKLHFIEPTLVEARQLGDGLGYLKIAMFPGMIGSRLRTKYQVQLRDWARSIASSSTCVATPAEGLARFV